MSTPPCDRLLLIACGSVHAAGLYDYLVRLRGEVAAEIRLVATEAGGRFLPSPVVRLFVSELVSSMWEPSVTMPVPHVQLARWAQAVLVLPATANMLGKAANGIADDLASTLLLTSPPPIIFAPAMNQSMWQAPPVRRNVRQLRADGHEVIEPAAGSSALGIVGADGEIGVGPTPDLVLTHTTQVVFRQLRASYLAEATAEAPVTPAAGARVVHAPEQPKKAS